MADEGDNNNIERYEEGTTVVMVWDSSGRKRIEIVVPIITHVYRGEEGEIIPREATHIIVGEDVTFVRERAFRNHPNIVEVICHEKVEKIEFWAFDCCPNLRRVIMPGVKIVGESAFEGCRALTDMKFDKLEIIEIEAFCSCYSLMSINLPTARIVEGAAFQYCTALTDVKFGSKLEIIGVDAFTECKSLRSINLSSARIVKGYAFAHCTALTTVKFGSKLERFERYAFEETALAFYNCRSLERITIPLKDGLITEDNIFQGCESLTQVDLVEGELHETIAALHLEEWRNDMNEAINSINRILPDASAGYYDEEYGEEDDEDYGEKARAIRRWIRSILFKIIDYQEEHQRILDEFATTLQLALPNDIVVNNVLFFLELPSHTFEVEGDEDEEELDASYSEGEETEREEDSSGNEEEWDNDADDA